MEENLISFAVVKVGKGRGCWGGRIRIPKDLDRVEQSEMKQHNVA